MSQSTCTKHIPISITCNYFNASDFLLVLRVCFEHSVYLSLKLLRLYQFLNLILYAQMVLLHV